MPLIYTCTCIRITQATCCTVLSYNVVSFNVVSMLVMQCYFLHFSVLHCCVLHCCVLHCCVVHCFVLYYCFFGLFGPPVIKLSKLIEKLRIIGPPLFHDRFHLAIDPEQSILQHQMIDLVNHTKQQSMILNSKKTKCIPFINSLTKDFLPELYVDEGEPLEVICKIKLVGLVICSGRSTPSTRLAG